MTAPDEPPRYTPYINAEEVRRRRAASERMVVRYEPVPRPRGATPSFIAVYTMADGTERAFVTTRVRRGRVGPKELALWPGVWTHHRELGDGGPLVLPVTDPMGEEEQGEEP